jgi:hypothetical protein
MDIQSRIGTVHSNQKELFEVLSDFRKLALYIPSEQITELVYDADNCNFNIQNIGKFGMQFSERIPHEQVRIKNTKIVPFNFELTIKLSQVSEKETKAQAFLKADLNPFLKLVAQKPLSQFVETLISKLELHNQQ